MQTSTQQTATKGPVPAIRSFNRFYTDLIGLLNRNLLGSAYSLAEARILYEIQAGKKVQASRIMQVLRIDKSYLSRILKKLEKEKLITRDASSRDARVILIALTPKGAREFDALNQASDQQIGKLLGPLSEKQQLALVAHMKAIQKILQ